MKKNIIVITTFVYIFSALLLPFSYKLNADTLKSLWGSSGSGIFTSTVTSDFQAGDINAKGTVSDMNGGIISGYDGSNSLDNFAQRVDKSGNKMWGADGINLSNGATGTQKVTNAASDGEGGAIFTWEDNRSGTYNIYAQRIKSDGTVLWTLGGVQVTNIASSATAIAIDGTGGAFIYWYDQRSGNNIYGQRINSSGVVQWTANGILLSTLLASSIKRVAYDGSGGVYITFTNGSNVGKIQRVDSTGTELWTAGGITISGLSMTTVSTADIGVDASKNVYVLFAPTVSGTTRLYAQKFDTTGSLLWGANGTAIANLAFNATNANMVVDQNGNTFVGWTDTRNTNNNAFYQQINNSGTVQCTTNGVKLFTGTWTQNTSYIIKDGPNNIISVVNDSRKVLSSVYLQRFDMSCAATWYQDGYPLYSSSAGINAYAVYNDGNGGSFIVTRDATRSKVFKIAATESNRTATIEDNLSRINESTASSHTITFLTDTGIDKNNNFTVTLPVGFAFGGSYDFNDIQLQQGSTNNCRTATYTAKTLAAAASGTTWGATYSSNTVTIIADTDTIPPARCVRVILNTNGAGHTLTNPAVSGDTVYHVVVNSSGQTGDAAIIILDDLGTPDSDQIQINAVLNTTVSLDLDTVVTSCVNSTETGLNTVNLGVLTPGSVSKSGTTINFICIDAATNGGLGMDIFTRSNRSNAAGGLVSGGNVIASATANLNAGGTTSGYGLTVNSVGTFVMGSFSSVSPYNSGVSGSVGLIPGLLTTASKILDSSAAVQTSTTDRPGIEVAAKASNVTPQGSYTDIITFTAIVNF